MKLCKEIAAHTKKQNIHPSLLIRSFLKGKSLLIICYGKFYHLKEKHSALSCNLSFDQILFIVFKQSILKKVLKDHFIHNG